MTDTVNLGLPCIEGSQAQKHVTHNDALRLLDTLVQLAVTDRDLAAPPGAPVEGERFIVKAGATGAWSGHDDAIAAWQDGGWQFSAPRIGWLAYVADEGLLRVWNGSAWVDVFAALTALQNLTLLGLGTTADAGNPLSAKLNNALFAARTVAEGGDGHLRYKLSKENAAKTLSFLFQDNWSGRAEIGLTGDDDFHFKVSPDGGTWFDGIKIDRSSGRVSFPVSGGPREVLAGDRTYYVRTDGSDANNGLADTAGGAWASLQHAADVVFGTLDLGGHNVTVKIADGSYAAGVYALGEQVGAGRIIFAGNNAAPGNVVVNGAAGPYQTFRAEAGAFLTVRDMELRSATAGLLGASRGARVYFSNVRCGTSNYHQIRAEDGGVVFAEGDYAIVGNSGQTHWSAASAVIRVQARTITLLGTPNFASSFAAAAMGGALYVNGNTFVGSAVGVRYVIESNAAALTNAAGPSYLPGSAMGTTTTGGQYA